MRSDRLQLINCGTEILKAAIIGNEALAAVLGVAVPAGWTEFGAPIFRYSLDKLEADPASQPWWTYLIIHLTDQVLIGTCGFKGPPLEGRVDIGYEISPNYRGQGFATEATSLLVQHALQQEQVSQIQAHTLVGPNASTRVLEKSGFCFVEALESMEGQLWKWEYGL